MSYFLLFPPLLFFPDYLIFHFVCLRLCFLRAPLVAEMVKNLPHLFSTKSFQILLFIVSPAISKMELCVYCEVWIPCFIFPWTASFPSSISSLVRIFSTDVQCHFVTLSFYLYRSVFSLLQFYIFFMMPLFLYCVFLSCRVAPPFFLFLKIIPTFSLLL